MKFSLQLKEAILNLAHAKLRTFLALLGILVGTASVVAMVSGGKIATNAALKQIQSLGTDLLGVSISAPRPKMNEAISASIATQLSLQQAMDMAQESSDIVASAPYTQLFSDIHFDNLQLEGALIGTTQSMADIVGVQLAQGRFISFLDGISMNCVIGNTLYEEIKRHSVKAILGSQLQLEENYCTIIGILRPWPENGFIFVDLNKAIIMPIEASLSLSQYTQINNVIFKLKKTHAPIDNINQVLTAYVKKHVPNANLYFRSPQQLLDSMKKQSDILTIFLGFVGGVALLVGGIGVMNIMLVSVMERRREIGIRLAVGARRKDIQLLFLIEAIVLSLIGGFLGVGAGILISYIVAIGRGWTFTFFILPPIIGFFVSVMVGIFFGFYPAYKASKLDPIEALRME